MANREPIAQPIAQPLNDGAIAPWPTIDKIGTLTIGPGLSLAYVSSLFRLSLIGYRQQYVDLLEEMLEKDPHAFAVLSKRVMGVSGAHLTITPPECESGTQDEALAAEIATECSQMIDGLPSLDERLTELAWASYFAMVGQETHWARDGRLWFPDRLSFIHSRRLSYPMPSSWDLYIWDQGPVLGDMAVAKTNRLHGFRVADAPGKFIIHSPQIRGGYPTRNGLGRQIAYWMVLKNIASRGVPRYLERFANPWPEATFATGTDGKPGRNADEADIADAKASLRAMGAGSISSWCHADTIKLDLRTPDHGSTKAITYAEWLTICDSQISKAVLGGTLGTDPGTHGARSLGETQGKGELKLLRHDAGMLASTIKRDLIDWIVRLNWPNAPRRLYPQVTISVEDDPDPLQMIEKGAKAANAGMPVDADELAKRADVPLVKPGDITARRMFPIMPQKEPAAFDEDLAARAADIAAKYGATDTDDDQGHEGDATSEEDDGVTEPAEDDNPKAGAEPDDEEA